MKVSWPRARVISYRRWDGVLRLDDAAARLVLGKLQAALGFPGVDLTPPSGLRLGVHRRIAGFPSVQQGGQGLAGVGDDGHLDRDVLVDGRSVDVDVDLARFLAEGVEPSGHPIVETRADRQQHVAAMHREVGLVGAVHAQHAEELGVTGGVAAQTHQRVGHGEAGDTGEPSQCFRRGGAGVDDAAAGVDHRPLGLLQQCDGLGDLSQVGIGVRPVAGMVRHRFGVRSLVDDDVLRQVDHHRAGPAAAGDVEGLVHHAG